jgi:hypothetical protein
VAAPPRRDDAAGATLPSCPPWVRNVGNQLLAVGAGALALACLGCRQIASAPHSPTPVLSLTLVADEPTQVATITEGARPDTALPTEPRGIGPARVSLSVLDEAGDSYPLVPQDSLGHYRVTLAPRAGATYRLAGEIDAVPVSAHTTVPALFEIRAPPGDTISTADGTASLVTLTVPVEFLLVGATTVECRVISPTGAVVGAGDIAGTRGTLVFLRDRDVRSLVFLAYNLDAADWLVRSTPRGNVEGAFGGFGGALLARRALVAP